MARVVLIVDSETGELIDVAGNVREGGRYRRFAKRMLSAGGTQLDYGGAGGDSLSISKGGYAGREINLMADVVKVSGDLLVGGKTIEEIASVGSDGVLGSIKGTEDQIDVREDYEEDPDTGDSRRVVRISLDSSVLGKMEMIVNALAGISAFVSKSDIAAVVQNLQVRESDTLEDLKGTVRVLLERMYELAGLEPPASSDSSDSGSGEEEEEEGQS